MKKLLYITTNLQGSGGVSRVLSVKLNYLIESYNYKVHVITTNNKHENFFFSFNKKINFYKISVENISVFNLSKYKRELQNVLDEVKPEIVINCDNGLKGVLLPYLINTDAKLIYEMHGSKDMVHKKVFEHLKFKLANFITQKSINKYSKFIVLTKEHKNKWIGNNIQVLHNPITISSAYKAITKEKKVIAVGRYSYEKGYERLFRIWKKITEKHSEWKLEIYGDGDKSKYLKQLRELGLEEKVKLNGAVSDIEKEYVEASIFVNTSFSEAFPLSMIEAMSCGLPVIAFKTNGASQLINDNVNGYLIEQDDVSDFVIKLGALINDVEKRKLMSSDSKKSVQKYNLDAIMKQWDRLFTSLE